MQKLKLILNILFIIVTIAFFISLAIWYENKRVIPTQETASKIIKNGQNINYINIGFLSNLQELDFNPMINNDRVIYEILNLIYEPLFSMENNNLNSVLVNNYSAIEDNNAYIFQLKENIYWHNNKMLTSYDIQYTIEYLLNSEDSYYYNYLDNIQNIKVIDNLSFRINLLESELNFEKKLIFPIISEDVGIGTGKYMIYENDNADIISLKSHSTNKNTSEHIEIINIFLYNNTWELCQNFKETKLDMINTDTNEYIDFLGQIGYRKMEYQTFEGKVETLLYSDKIYGTIKPDQYTIFQNINTWKKII